MFNINSKRNTVQLVRQHDLMDCGPASLSMVTSYFGNKFSITSLRDLCNINKNGVSMFGIIHAARSIGFETSSVRLNLDKLLHNFRDPCILFWNKNHFVVLESISRKNDKNRFHIADPAHGKITLSEKQFINSWFKDERSGIALLLNPTETFFSQKSQKNTKERFKPVLSLIKPYKKKILLLSLLVFVGSILNILLPFLTEALIDRGVNQKNVNLVTLIILAQLFVFLGVLVINGLRNWFTLVIGTKLSIDIIYSYLDKILRLPISFFDTKNSGDFNQRIQDNIKIEQFLTSESILTIFSVLTLLIYSFILLYYDVYLFLAYTVFTVTAIAWSYYWLKKREVVDYQLFKARSENQEAVYEFYNGIKEMKLNQYENKKKSEWVSLQKNLFGINIKSLKIEQFQSIGFSFFNQVKNISVTFLSAIYVIEGHMTLGALLSVSFIIGQMNAPVQQLLNFFRSQQDALLSFNRLSEVYTQKNEESKENVQLPEDRPVNIQLKNINFRYDRLSDQYALKNINLDISPGQTTAIVGHSGSGKTTLMKLLLKFFPLENDGLQYGQTKISNVSARSIRKQTGVVMQDGYIFNGTIEMNIALNDEGVDREKLYKALETVNLKEYVESLTLKELTKIGAGGTGLSGGQKQRVLIARAIYKDPNYIFFDEATSALDSTNEKTINENLQSFFRNKTVIIIAHRLSTVKNADKIIVLSEGQVVEQGTHDELLKEKKSYYTLVKNQLNI